MKVSEEYYKAGVIHSNECEVCQSIVRKQRVGLVKRSEGVFWAVVATLAVSFMVLKFIGVI
jgi:hypothetical protein